jgi:hypothetical protein
MSQAAVDMDKARQILEVVEGFYNQKEKLRALAGTDEALGALLWTLWREGTLDAAATSGWWYPLYRAGAGAYSAADLHRLLTQLQRAPRGTFASEALWRGWHDDLDSLVEALPERAALVEGLAAIPLPVRDGLAIALVRLGELPPERLPEGALEHLAGCFARSSSLTGDHYEGFDRVFGEETWARAVCAAAADPTLDHWSLRHLSPMIPHATPEQLLVLGGRARDPENVALVAGWMEALGDPAVEAALAAAPGLAKALKPKAPDRAAMLVGAWLPGALAARGRPRPEVLGPLFAAALAGASDDADYVALASASAAALTPAQRGAAIHAARSDRHGARRLLWAVIGQTPTPEVMAAAVKEVTDLPRRDWSLPEIPAAIAAWGAAGVGPVSAGYARKAPRRDLLARGAADARDPAWAPLLVEMLADNAAAVSGAAVEGLVALGDGALEALEGAAGGRKKALRLGAAEVLGRLPRTPAVEALARKLLEKEKSAEVREKLAAFAADAPAGAGPARPEGRLQALLAPLTDEHRAAAIALLDGNRSCRKAAKDLDSAFPRDVPRASRAALLADVATSCWCRDDQAALFWAALEDDDLAPWLAVDFFEGTTAYQGPDFLDACLRRWGDAFVPVLTWALGRQPRPGKYDRPDPGVTAIEALQRHKPAGWLEAVASALDARSAPRGRAAALALAAAGPEAAPLLLPSLSHSRADVRARAAEALVELAAPGAAGALEAAMASERSKKVREVMGRALFAAQQAGQGPVSETPATAAGHAALDARLAGQPGLAVPKWLDAAALPALSWRSGAPLSEGAMAWVINRLTLEGPDTRDPDLEPALARADPAGFAPLLAAIEARYKEQGPKKDWRWVLFARAYLADEAQLEDYAKGLDELARFGSSTQAFYGLQVLRRSNTDGGVRWLDHWARKARSRGLKERAGEALDELAADLGVTRAEVAERAVPTLGFDRSCRQPFPYGGRALSLLLLPGNAAVLEDDSGRRFKSAPAPLKGDDPAEIKARKAALGAIKRTLKANTTAQLERMELALVRGRRWSVDGWRRLYLEHPIIHPLGRTVLWEAVIPGGAAVFFYLSEERELLDADYEPVSLEGVAGVRLAHPAAMPAGAADAWGGIFADNELIQPLEQLTRPVTLPPPEGRTPLGDLLLTGRETVALHLHRTLERLGYERGPVEDGGAISSSAKDLGDGWQVVVGHEGLGVIISYLYDADMATVKSLSFFRGKQRVAEHAVPPRVYSEAARDLEMMIKR